ncbi:Uncharacterised protein [Acinetobacter baumannii]|nr:Uncharacterised protein [Acinetobacter baumannii]
MLTCREATQLLSEKQDRILNFKEMSALQFHVLMCSSCRRFGKQMKSLSLLSKQYKKFDEEQNEPYRVCRRVNILRDYPDDKTKLYPRN